MCDFPWVFSCGAVKKVWHCLSKVRISISIWCEHTFTITSSSYRLIFLSSHSSSVGFYATSVTFCSCDWRLLCVNLTCWSDPNLIGFAPEWQSLSICIRGLLYMRELVLWPLLGQWDWNFSVFFSGFFFSCLSPPTALSGLMCHQMLVTQQRLRLILVLSAYLYSKLSWMCTVTQWRHGG